jgi:hypothetical protein
VLDSDLRDFVHSGVAVAVATRDGELRPALTRAWGPELSADRRTLTLCVIAPPGSRTHANLDEKAAVAVGFSLPTIARAAQVKGAVVAVGEPGPAELERAERHLSLFHAQVEQLGPLARRARRLYTPADFVSITIAVDEVFDQTPGPVAGRRL